MILGQEKICNLIDSCTLDTFPKSLMLVGMNGSGKHLICQYVSDRFNLPLKDITESLTLETLENIYESVEPTIYTIEINKITVQKANLILKFLEEPMSTVYIILIAESEIGVLPTVLNRCQIWQLQHYSRDVLTTFLKNKNSLEILEVAQTPGQILALESYPYNEMIALADKIIKCIDSAILSNTMKLSTYIAYKDEKDKYDVRLFTDVLLSRLTNAWKVSNCADTRLVNAYLLTAQLKQTLYLRNVDAKSVFEKYLIDLRTLMRGAIL